MSTARVTTSDIAARLNINQSTVSRALKNDRRISKATVDLVQKTAAEMNYRPDPMLSSLVAYRQAHTKTTYQATLGWITNYPTRSGWREYERIDYFRGATRRAAELGYVIEEFWLREVGMSQKRITQILTARGIQGLFFSPQPRSRAHLSLDWNKFSAITFGHTLAYPVFHNVAGDYFRSFALLMRQIKRLGYRRPGFTLWPRIHETTNRTWASAFNAYQPRVRQKAIPIFLNQRWSCAEFKKWYQKYEPDVVIAHNETPLQWLKEIGLGVPADVGFALAAKHPEFSPDCSGIDENSEFIAEAAVNILVDMINRGESGIPRRAISTLIQGEWVEGKTLRRLNNAAAES